MAMRIGLIGAAGRLGSAIAVGLADLDDLELVCAVSPSHAGRTLGSVVPGLDPASTSAALVVEASLDALVTAGVEVAVEVSVPSAGGANLRWLLEHGIHAVVGTTGIGADDLDAARELAAAGPARAVVAPNFSLGAVLVERFAAEAARLLPQVEIVELHHDAKLDAPSGTALATAEAIAAARGGTAPREAATEGPRIAPGARGHVHHGVPIHSVRLQGLLAHEEVLFGGPGQSLTLRHDAFDRSAFVPGVALACRRVGGLDGLVVGLGALL